MNERDATKGDWVIPRGYAKAMFGFYHRAFTSKFKWRPKKRNVEMSRRKKVRRHG